MSKKFCIKCRSVENFISQSRYNVKGKQLQIKLELTHNETVTSCSLRDSWIYTFVTLVNEEVEEWKITIGQHVRIIDPVIDDNDCLVIDDNSGLVILEPDTLVSGTVLTSSLFCRRKAFLADRFTSSLSQHGDSVMLVGTLVHELVEESCSDSATQISDEFLRNLVRQMLTRIPVLEQLMCSSEGKSNSDDLINNLEKQIEPYFENVRNFSQVFMRKNNILKDGSMKNAIAKIVQVDDIEENLWCPIIGMKGKIDITAKVNPITNMKSVERWPVEIKTGKNSFSFEHQAQLIMYSLMMNLHTLDVSTSNENVSFTKLQNRNDSRHMKENIVESVISAPSPPNHAAKKSKLNSNSRNFNPSIDVNLKSDDSVSSSVLVKSLRPGILYYIKSKVYKPVTGKWRDVRSLVQLRNSYIHHQRDILSPEKQQGCEGENEVISEKLCPTVELDHLKVCSNCPQLLPCTLYSKLNENSRPLKNNKSMRELIPSTTKHLSRSELQFFQKYSLMYSVEQQKGGIARVKSSNSQLSDLWNMTADDRCARFILQQIGSATLCLNNLNYDEERQHFIYSTALLDNDIATRVEYNVGSRVVISGKDGRLAISTGHITEVHYDQSNGELLIKVRLDKSIPDDLCDRKYILDEMVYDGNKSLSICFSNLLNLMENDENMNMLRTIICDENFQPTFKATLSNFKDNLVEKAKKSLKHLNRVQQRAVLRALMSNSYCLIEGMPGTGKTTWIASCIRFFQSINLSVLVVSYTHSAVNNVVERLLKMDPSLASKTCCVSSTCHSCSALLRPVLLENILGNSTPNSVNKLRDLYNTFDIVATTSLSVHHPLISCRRQTKPFDYCIVDEACQATFLSTLGPLLYARKFVLVGDTKQLGPIVQSDLASQMGLSVSMYEYLKNRDETNKRKEGNTESDDNKMKRSAVIDLNIQYRMNGEVMSIANSLFYKGQLQCGSEAIRCQTIAKFKKSEFSETDAWLTRCLSCELSESLVFVNHDGNVDTSSDHEKVLENKYVNKVESEMCTRLITCFRQCFNDSLSIGIIAPYRAQVKLLRQSLSERGGLIKSQDINTIDQFQGREVDILICSFTKYSCVRSEKSILNDWRRLNVALTRPRSKLILLGSTDKLKKNFPITFDPLIKHFENKKAVQDYVNCSLKRPITQS